MYVYNIPTCVSTDVSGLPDTDLIPDASALSIRPWDSAQLSPLFIKHNPKAVDFSFALGNPSCNCGRVRNPW